MTARANEGVGVHAQDDIAVRTHRAAEHFVDQLFKWIHNRYVFIRFERFLLVVEPALKIAARKDNKGWFE